MKRAAIIIGLILALTGVGYYIVFLKTSFRLVKTDPSNGFSSTSANQSIIFYFNKPLAMPKAEATEAEAGYTYNSVRVTPQLPGHARIDGKKVIFQPGIRGFDPGTTYTVLLSNIKSQDGRSIKDVTIKFKVAYVPFDKLSKDQQKQDINNTDQFHDTNTPRNNLIKQMPYSTSGYSIDYVTDGDYFTVRITDTPVATQKESALQYLSKNGIDTKVEKISFFVIKGLY